MAKPMSKSKIVAHMADKVGTSKKVAAQFFDELFKLAVKEAKGSAGKFVIPNIGRAVKRSEEHRVGKECRSWWSPYHSKKNINASIDQSLAASCVLFGADAFGPSCRT